jgi:hypothetical protein
MLIEVIEERSLPLLDHLDHIDALDYLGSLGVLFLSGALAGRR